MPSVGASWRQVNLTRRTGIGGCDTPQMSGENEIRSNIVLIGMPGSGKSTVGVVLAKQAGCDFVDTDVIIQTSQGRTLQDIVDRDGHLALRRIEEEVLLGLSLRNHVIATGGSAVYSERAMAHLRSEGIPVFLDVDLSSLEARVRDFGTRGLAKRPGQSFGELYEERLPLYRRHAEITVECGALTHEEVAASIAEELRARGLLPSTPGRGEREGQSGVGRQRDPKGGSFGRDGRVTAPRQKRVTRLGKSTR